MTTTQATESVYCACGAAWHGRAVVNNPVIDYHRISRKGCRIVTHEEYLALLPTGGHYRCACPDCRELRRARQRRIDKATCPTCGQRIKGRA